MIAVVSCLDGTPVIPTTQIQNSLDSIDMNRAAAAAPRGKNPGHSSGLTRLRRNDSSQRILVQPGDTLLLRYTPREEALNFGIVTFFTFGIGELLRN